MKSTLERIHEISYELGDAYRSKIAFSGCAVIATAYALSVLQEDKSASSESLNAFLETANLSASVSDVLSRTLSGLWDTVVSFIDKFETDELKEVVLYENSFFDMSTPTSLIILASKILNIGSTDSVLEICSGTATFPVYALFNQSFSTYTGIEINYNANDIAILKASLLGDNYTFILNNALTYKYPANYDKIFSNYPFALRGSELDECRRELQEYFNLDSTQISRCSSDWLFNAAIVRSLKENGKAVAIMTNGAAFNKPDVYMRQFLAENGYIEAVINLPAKLFTEFGIPTTMIVFSYNNSKIKLINAQDMYSKEDRRVNMLSDDDIEAIINCISNGGKNTIELTPAELSEHDYTLMATRYLEKPVVENGVPFESVIKSITRGSQVKADLLESYKSVLPTKYRFISLSNIINGSIDIEDGKQYISELPKALEKFVAPNNSLVLSKMASPTFRSAVVNTANDQSVVATGNLYIIELDESKVNPYFIQAFFDSELGEETLNYASGGSTVKTISAEAVKSILIPLPPLEEQNEIAVKYQAALDEYGILQRKMQRLIERKRTLLNNEG
ncbi:N-6 DNA methylase [Ruminococcus sp.]|uniref:N-6 DNA methylase n=1 Tax=Ruminococcus sp. TaxID=41978 RepID=UPI0025DD572E|nr:N-6 DNA methylase [Ruminococcus sp.]